LLLHLGVDYFFIHDAVRSRLEEELERVRKSAKKKYPVAGMKVIWPFNYKSSIIVAKLIKRNNLKESFIDLKLVEL